MPKQAYRLTRQDLNEIQAGNKRNSDIKALLNELRVLRGILHNSWQVFDALPTPPVNSPLDRLIGLVNNEPCVKEQRADYERVGQGKIGGKK